MAETRLERQSDGAFRVQGDLNFHSVPKVWQSSQLLLSREQTDEWTIDLQDIGRADSAGIALLIEWLRLATQANKSIRYTHVPQQMQAIMQVCDLQEILPIA